jgi:Ca2+-binding RTX toxin-like protein
MTIARPIDPPADTAIYWSLTQFSVDRSTLYPGKPDYWLGYSNDIQVFDINGDGHLDVVQVYSYVPPLDKPGLPIRILLGDGKGGLTDATNTLISGGVPLGDAATGTSVADFNGDGVKDFFISVTWETPQPKAAQNILLLSDGHGGVVNATSTLPQLNDYSHWSTAGDIDGDDDIDIVVQNIGPTTDTAGTDSTPYILINDGVGHFTRDDSCLPTAIETGQDQFTSNLLFDADGDGDNDLLQGMWGPQGAFLGRPQTSSLLLFNDGTGQFAQTSKSLLPPPLFSADKNEVLDTKAIDLDGDGDQDLILLMHNQQSRGVQILINSGKGTFRDDTAARISATETDPRNTGRYLKLADINGDGVTDLILQTGGPNRIYLNDGAGRFIALPADFLFANAPDGNYAFVPGDFNEDGRTDMFVRQFINQWDDPQHPTEFSALALWKPASAAQLAGDDTVNTLLGTAGAETISGKGGADIAFGGAGNDRIDGGTGADYMNGGKGNDIFVVDNAGDKTIEVAGGGTDTVRAGITWTLSSHVEVLVLNAGSGSIGGTGNATNNIITGNESANLLSGLAGNDRLSGGLGNDYLRGGAGDDALNGGAGRDRIHGELGQDTLTGGADADTFVFGTGSSGSTAASADRIIDFSHAEKDLVSLSAIDANTALAGNQTFAFIGGAAFSAAGQLRYVRLSGNTFIAGDTNGDGKADLVIRLDGLHTLVAGDFVL